MPGSAWSVSLCVYCWQWHAATIKPEISKVFKNQLWPVHMRGLNFGPVKCVKETCFTCWICMRNKFRSTFDFIWINESFFNHVFKISFGPLWKYRKINFGPLSNPWLHRKRKVDQNWPWRYLEKFHLVARKIEINDFRPNEYGVSKWLNDPYFIRDAIKWLHNTIYWIDYWQSKESLS